MCFLQAQTLDINLIITTYFNKKASALARNTSSKTSKIRRSSSKTDFVYLLLLEFNKFVDLKFSFANERFNYLNQASRSDAYAIKVMRSNNQTAHLS